MKIISTRILPLLTVALLFSSIFYAIISYNTHLNAALPINSTPCIIEIKTKTTAGSLAQLLYNRHLVSSPLATSLVMRAYGYSAHLQAGIYEIKPGENLIQLLKRIVQGDVLVLNFRIAEGSTLFDLQNNLSSAPYLNKLSLTWDKFNQKYKWPEGLFLADTYQYQAGSNAEGLLKRAYDNLLNNLNKIWQARAPNLPYKNSYELLIAASIIEKEAALTEERKIIAGIIVKRLQKNMPLQMDPTVLYARQLKIFKSKNLVDNQALSHADLKINSTYNTYLHRNLPPTPIAMVSKDALLAAAFPTISNYLYFVAKGNGTHQFSATYKEQQQAIRQLKAREKK